MLHTLFCTVPSSSVKAVNADSRVGSLDLSTHQSLLQDGRWSQATFAGGCFWCLEPPFRELLGVKGVFSGFAGPWAEHAPSYWEVATGKTSYREAVQVFYDPKEVSYEVLVETYWRHIDPTDPGGQFADRGRQYTTAILAHDDSQREIAEVSKQELAKSGRFELPIVTPIEPFEAFFPAEPRHQDYARRNPLQYSLYERGSGRKAYFKKMESVWEPILSTRPAMRGRSLEQLSPLEFAVTQEGATEPPYQNEYWNVFEPGVYVDRVSGAPLFSSRDKYDAGCGWPSFSRPLPTAELDERDDWKLRQPRTEVVSRDSQSHLGHVFDDGPSETGTRYCINSAALRFVPKSEMVAQGYGDFLQFVE